MWRSVFRFGTLIAHGSRLYEQAVALRIGQRVRFSGTFFAHGNDCVRELSATSGGSLRAPEFAFRFTEIRPDR